jgi:hypothetical protein
MLATHRISRTWVYTIGDRGIVYLLFTGGWFFHA